MVDEIDSDGVSVPPADGVVSAFPNVLGSMMAQGFAVELHRRWRRFAVGRKVQVHDFVGHAAEHELLRFGVVEHDTDERRRQASDLGYPER